MDNWNNFCKIVDELLETNSAYENEISIFKKYLKSYKLQDSIFNLNTIDIDNYFEYCFENGKIGAPSTLTTHFSALKTLFKYLQNKNINFKSLHGYVNMPYVKKQFTEKLESSLKTSIINDNLLQHILYDFDTYIESNKNRQFKQISKRKRFLNVLIARLYIKISLIVPLKTNEIINLNLSNIRSKDFRVIKYNEIVVNIPNSIRIQMIETIDYIEKNCNIYYNEKINLFEFLFNALDVKLATSTISTILNKSYEEIGLNEMLFKKESGAKMRALYTPESYKTTAILSMLKNGTDILALKQITGLDFAALIKNYNLDVKIENLDIKSTEINCGVSKTNYFTYL